MVGGPHVACALTFVLLGACSTSKGTGAVSCPTTVFSGVTPDALAIDGHDVYWGIAEQGSPYVGASALDGSGNRFLVTDGPYGPNALAVDATSVYWANVGITGGIFKVPLSGGDVTMLAPDGETLAIDDTNVYFSDDESGVIAKVPLAGGAAVPLATGFTDTDGSGTNTPSTIAVDADNVYFGTRGTTNTGTACLGTINRIPIAGGSMTTIGSGYCLPQLVAGASGVFFAAQGGLYRISDSGPTMVAATALPANALALDSDNAYLSEPGQQGSVVKVSLTDGSAEPVIANVYAPAAIAVGESCVYVAAAQGQGGVFSAPK